MRWRVQGLCYESRARVRNQQRGQLGGRAIQCVVERMNGREAEACNRIFSNREFNPGEAAAVQLQIPTALNCTIRIPTQVLPG